MAEFVFSLLVRGYWGGYLNSPKLGFPGCKLDKMIRFIRGNSRLWVGSLQFDSTKAR